MSWAAWLGGPTNPSIEALMGALVRAHQRAALDNANASSAALALSASVGMPFQHAVASALLTLGGPHGPVTQAREMLYDCGDAAIIDMIRARLVIPGFGNAFHKEGLDPAWTDMEAMLWEFYPERAKRLDQVQAWLLEHRGVRLWPNAAAFTAIVAEILGLPRGLEMILPVMARLPAWALQYREATL